MGVGESTLREPLAHGHDVLYQREKKESQFHPRIGTEFAFVLDGRDCVSLYLG